MSIYEDDFKLEVSAAPSIATYEGADDPFEPALGLYLGHSTYMASNYPCHLQGYQLFMTEANCASMCTMTG